MENEVKNSILGKRIKNDDLSKLLIEEDPNYKKYFAWRVFSYYNGDSTKSYRLNPFQILQNQGPIIIPPKQGHFDNIEILKKCERVNGIFKI